VYLLLNSGRYGAVDDQPTQQHRAQVGVRLSRSQCMQAVGRVPPPLATAATSRDDVPLAEITLGEAKLEVRIPRGLAEEDGSELDCMAYVNIPLRAMKWKSSRMRFRYPPGVVKELCDFLTVASGSYVTFYDWEGKPDRPVVDTGMEAIGQGFLDLAGRDGYGRLFDAWLGMGWHYHGALVNAFACYRLALALSSASPSLSYVLLVAAMEACGSQFSEAEPSFSDFSRELRRAVAEWQSEHNADDRVVERLRDHLTKAEGPRLRARAQFRDVVNRYLPDAFWRANDEGSSDADSDAPGTRVTRRRLKSHLDAIYDSRSAFVHQAAEFPLQAVQPGCEWVPSFATNEKTGCRKEKRQMLPTLSWFARVTREVLLTILDDAQACPARYRDKDGDVGVDPEVWLIKKGLIQYHTFRSGSSRPATDARE